MMVKMKKNKMLLLIFVQMFIVSSVILSNFLPNLNQFSWISIEYQNSEISTDAMAVTLWQANGTIICNNDSSDVQDIQVCCDGAGGAIFVWEDNRDDGGDIYAQKIGASGNILWGANGTAVCKATGTQSYSTICCDAAGGAIIVWQDDRTGTADIYAQRIDRNGKPLWTENGIVICNAFGNQGLNEHNSLICCYSSYVIIAYQDYRSGNADIYAQKLDFLGNIYWGNGSAGDRNGTVICNTTDSSSNPVMCCDGVGGAIIAWSEDRSLGTDSDIYAQHIDTNGNTFWGDGSLGDNNGTFICNITGDQSEPLICCTRNLGAIIAWEDDRAGLPGDGIFAQRIDMNGNIYWGDGSPGDKNGTVIRNYASNIADPDMCCFGDGSAIIVWGDYRGSGGIYAQRVDLNGITYWGNNTPSDRNGTVICHEVDNQENPMVCCYDSKYAIVTWNDDRYNSSDDSIYVQKIDLNGTIYWNNGTTNDKNGSNICNTVNDNSYPVICCDGSGGAIIGWFDQRRDYTSYDLYAQKIKGETQGQDLSFILLLLTKEPANEGLIFGLIFILIAVGAGIVFIYLRER